MSLRSIGVGLAALCAVSALPTQATPLLNGFGGPRGYGDLAMSANDDGSSNLLPLPFGINLFGQTFSQFYINNNGNITFNSPLWSYTPDPFPVTQQPMIGPYWADVDTRGGSSNGSNNVWVASPNNRTAVVTWDQVGYFSNYTDKLNDFQLVLRDRSADTGTAGDFDIEFRYNALQWTTGDASGGSGGLGGTPAQAGYDAGDDINYLVLPGSRTAAVLDIQNQTNVAGGDPGFWSFAIRNGAPPGGTPDNPFMPVLTEAGWQFDFNVVLGQQVFIDPDVAVGYDYHVSSGPNITSVTLPNVGDGLYDLYLLDNLSWILTLEDLTAGTPYNFAGGGVSDFRILGIETAAMLDPGDPTAFVTGLTFANTGTVSMTQTPITEPVPAPSPLFLLAFAGLALRRRRPA